MNAVVEEVCHPHVAMRANGNTGGVVEEPVAVVTVGAAPSAEVVAFPREDLHPMVIGVGDIHAPVQADGHLRGIIELTVTVSLPSPLSERLAVPVKDLEAVAEKLGEIDFTVRANIEAGWGTELPRLISRLAP